MIFIKPVIFLLGFSLVIFTLNSAIRSFVLARSDNVFLTRVVFRIILQIFRLRLIGNRTYQKEDRIMALFPPITLLVLPIVWVILIIIGYMGMFWAIGIPTWYEALFLSGSSMLTLGFAPVHNLAQMLLAFSEATLGLGMVALLISYLPTMYNSFSKREALVTLLEVRAGSPPSAIEMIKRFYRIKGLDSLTEEWPKWEVWFAEIEESHTSLAPIIFFRSPKANRSWVTAAGTILDAAAFSLAVVNMPPSSEAALCLRSGYLALRSIVDFFGLPYNKNPKPDDPISITRTEFEIACNELIKQGVPLKADREQAWRDFAGWRVNYDGTLLLLASLTMAPKAPWSSDRARHYE